MAGGAPVGMPPEQVLAETLQEPGVSAGVGSHRVRAGGRRTPRGLPRRGWTDPDQTGPPGWHCAVGCRPPGTRRPSSITGHTGAAVPTAGHRIPHPDHPWPRRAVRLTSTEPEPGARRAFPTSLGAAAANRPRAAPGRAAATTSCRGRRSSMSLSPRHASGTSPGPLPAASGQGVDQRPPYGCQDGPTWYQNPQ